MKKEIELWSATDKEKTTKEYGLAFVQQVIWSEWFGEDRKKARYYTRKSEFSELRSHMDGTVDISKFKDQLGINTDKSTLAIDWSYLPTIPKYIKTVIDGYSDDIYMVNADAIDSYSQKEKRMKRYEIEAKMKMKDMVESISKETGYDFTFDEKLPETDEELFLELELNNKLKHEIAIENSSRKIFKVNEWSETFNKIAEDLSVLGVGAATHEIDGEYGVQLRYADPLRMVYSRDQYGNRGGKGRFYYGEVLSLTIEEVKRLANGQVDVDKIHQFATNYSKVSRPTQKQINSMSVDVVKFCFKATKTKVFKKKYNAHGGYKYLEKDMDWEPQAGRESTKVTSVYETWYGGYWIIGSDILWDYGEMKDLVRPKSNIRKAIAPYAIYDIGTQSLASKIRPMADQIQLTHLKIQIALAKMKAAGYMIDIDMLVDLPLGDGSTLTAQRQAEIWASEGGDILYSGKAMDGSINPRLPINKYPGSDLAELSNLLAVKESYRQDIENLTGINQYRDGSTPNAKALVGVQKLAIMMSNNATKHIFRGAESISLQIAEGIATRLQDLGIYGEVGGGISQLIGEENAEILSKNKDRFYWAFTMNLELKPTEEERANFMQKADLALQAKIITFADYSELMSVDNVKLAAKMLGAKEKAKAREERRNQREMVLIQEGEKRKTAQVNAQFKAEEFNAEIQKEHAIETLKARLKAISDSNEWIFKTKYMQAEYNRKERIARIEAGTKQFVENQKEDRKDNREKLNGDIQSDLAHQRSNGLPPKKFTEEEKPNLLG